MDRQPRQQRRQATVELPAPLQTTHWDLRKVRLRDFSLLRRDSETLLGSFWYQRWNPGPSLFVPSSFIWCHGASNTYCIHQAKVQRI